MQHWVEIGIWNETFDFELFIEIKLSDFFNEVIGKIIL